MILGEGFSMYQMRQSIEEWTEQNLWKTALSRPYPFNFYKDCLPQILLGPFLNTCTQMYVLVGLMFPPLRCKVTFE